MASLPKNHQATQKPYKYRVILGLKEKTSEDITKKILQKFDNDGINIKDCRG